MKPKVETSNFKLLFCLLGDDKPLMANYFFMLVYTSIFNCSVEKFADNSLYVELLDGFVIE